MVDIKSNLDDYKKKIDILNDNMRESTEENKLEYLKDFLADMPSEESRLYELVVTMIVQKVPDVFKLLTGLFNKTKNNKDPESEKISFTCFYAINIYYRRMKDTSRLKDFIEENRREYINDKHPIMYHLLSIYYKTLGGHYNMIKSLEYAKEASKRIEGHAGVLHNLAESIINVVNDGYADPNDINKMIIEAEEAVDEAIRLDPDFPKFYSTKAQIMAAKGDYQDAYNLIKTAIDKEDSSAADYPIRISGYIEVLFNIRIKELSARTNEKMKEIESQMNGFRNQSIELLGLFAAVISFTVASIQLVLNQPFNQGAMLLVVFSGCLLITYSSLSIILHGKTYWQRSLLVFLIGLLLTLLPIIYMNGGF
jgi:hypothetical protein